MFGKLLGAIIGLAVGLIAQGWVAAIVLVVVGVFVGHRYDQLHTAPDLEPGLEPRLDDFDTASVRSELPAPATREEIDAEARAHFARHVSTLFAELARADGEVVRDEVRVVRQFFETELKFTRRELELVRLSLKSALDEPGDLDEALRECVSELSGSERLLLLDALYELALSDGELRKSEREVIRRIATGLRLSEAEQRSIAALHLGDGEEHCAKLGLPVDATDDEIRSAFRRLAATHHPDKVAHLGAGAMELAARRFQEIKEAYDELRHQRGF